MRHEPAQPTLNLLKTAAGLQEIDQLVARQKGNAFRRGGETLTFAYTRFMPKRGEEILESGGSIYWIMKNRIQVRQKILGFDMVEEADGKDWCKIVVEPQLTLTYAVQKRAIQGWRYLEHANVPKDKGLYIDGTNPDLPPKEMAEELRKLGLL